MRDSPVGETVRNPVEQLVAAAEAVWNASIRFGPVNDGRPVGDVFDKSLDDLNAARHEVQYNRESGYVPTLTLWLRHVRTPGGRGRNAAHWEATQYEQSWLQGVRGASQEVVIGKLILRHMKLGEQPPRVIIRYVDREDK